MIRQLQGLRNNPLVRAVRVVRFVTYKSVFVHLKNITSPLPLRILRTHQIREK